MSKVSLFTQIGMIVIAITIGIMYIKPTVTNIAKIQTTTTSYHEEADKVSAVNRLLSDQVAKVGNINPGDTAALNRYMPDTIDEMAIMKDITTVFDQVGVAITDISYGGAAEGGATNEAATTNLAGVTLHPFEVSANASYVDLKNVLAALEVNDYLLQIDSLTATPNEEDDTLAVTMNFSTFTRLAQVEEIATEAIME